MQFQLFEKSVIVVSRSDANFDRACDAVFQIAAARFGLDEDGYLRNVIGYQRSTDSLHVEFLEYRRIWHNHEYLFNSWVQREE